MASTKPPSRLVADKVFEVIDELCEQTLEPVWLVQKDLAEFLEVAPQTLSAAINQLRAAGRLEIIRRGNDYGYRTIRTDVQMPMIAAITPKNHTPRQETPTGGTTAGKSRNRRTNMSIADDQASELTVRSDEAELQPSSKWISDEPHPADAVNVDVEALKRR